MSNHSYEERSFEVRNVGVTDVDGKPHLNGLAAVFNSPSEPMSMRGRKVTEFVRPQAFDRALAERQDVIATVNHDPAKLLGRTSSGTLQLTKTADGLDFDIELPNTTDGNDIRELVQRGDMRGASFRFHAREDSWEENGSKRFLEDCDLFDVAIVTHPAYSASSVDLDFRSLELALTEIRAGKRISSDSEAQIQKAIATLIALLEGEEDDDPTEGDDPSMRSLDEMYSLLALTEKRWEPLARIL